MIRDRPLEYGDPVAYMLADRSGQGSCGRQYRPNTHLTWMGRRFPVDKWSPSAIIVTCSHVALCHPIPPGQECSKGKWPLAGAWEFSMFGFWLGVVLMRGWHRRHPLPRKRQGRDYDRSEYSRFSIVIHRAGERFMRGPASGLGQGFPGGFRQHAFDHGQEGG